MNVYKSEYKGCDGRDYGWSVIIAANDIEEAYKMAKKNHFKDKYFKLELVDGLQYNFPNPKIILGCEYSKIIKI